MYTTKWVSAVNKAIWPFDRLLATRCREDEIALSPCRQRFEESRRIGRERNQVRGIALHALRRDRP